MPEMFQFHENSPVMLSNCQRRKGQLGNIKCGGNGGEAFLQLVYRFHPLFVSYSTYVIIEGRKHQMMQTTGTSSTHLYLEYQQSRVLHHAKSRGVLWLPGFHITMSVVRMLRPAVLHTMWERSSFLLMQKIHITKSFLLTFEFNP